MNFYPFNFPADEGQVLIDGDCAVIIPKRHSHLCGYCALPAEQVPKEWHGDYNEDGLQYLNVHGGITYCEVHGDNDEERYRVGREAKERSYRECPLPTGDYPQNATIEQLNERMRPYNRARDAEKEALRSVPYTHVVFGFDCGHYQDDENPALRDPQHVMALARQMRQQLLAHIARLQEYREAGRERQIEIIDEIRKEAVLRSEVPIFSVFKLACESTKEDV